MTNETKHTGFTPGPWEIIDHEANYVGKVGLFLFEGILATAPDRPIVNAELQANAHLISKAPHLYAENQRLEAENDALKTQLKGAQARHSDAIQCNAEMETINAELLNTLREVLRTCEFKTLSGHNAWSAGQALLDKQKVQS